MAATHLNVTKRQDLKAGERLFTDFPGPTFPIYDEKSLEVSFEAELFVGVAARAITSLAKPCAAKSQSTG